MQQNQPVQLFPVSPPPPQPTHMAHHPSDGEPAGSPAVPPSALPTPPDMSTHPMAEQDIVSALQAMTANPDYTEFLQTMEQHWPGLRDIRLPQVTIPNTMHLNAQSPITIPHVNMSHDQPGHSRHGMSAQTTSPATATDSFQRGGDHRSTLRKRNNSPPPHKNPEPQQTRDSPTSHPPPDKKASNERQISTSKLSQLKSVVSEASVLPTSPQPQSSKPNLPQPIVEIPSTQESLSKRSTPRVIYKSKQQQPSSSVGYQGVSQPQRTVKDKVHAYPNLKVVNSRPTGTRLQKPIGQNKQSQAKRTPVKQPSYLPPMQNTKGTLVTKDAR